MKGKGKVPAVGGSDDSGDGKGKPSVGGTGQAAVGGKGQLLVFWQEVCHSNPTPVGNLWWYKGPLLVFVCDGQWNSMVLDGLDGWARRTRVCTMSS